MVRLLSLVAVSYTNTHHRRVFADTELLAGREMLREESQDPRLVISLGKMGKVDVRRPWDDPQLLGLNRGIEHPAEFFRSRVLIRLSTDEKFRSGNSSDVIQRAQRAIAYTQARLELP